MTINYQAICTSVLLITDLYIPATRRAAARYSLLEQIAINL